MPSAAAEGKYGAENTPLKVGNTLYVCTPKNIMIAIDPATGQTRWRYDPKVPDEAIPYTAACRGASSSAWAGRARAGPAIRVRAASAVRPYLVLMVYPSSWDVLMPRSEAPVCPRDKISANLVLRASSPTPVRIVSAGGAAAGPLFAAPGALASLPAVGQA